MEVFEDLGNRQETVKLTDIIRTIFDSCDVDNTDLVQVSELINVIKPYFQEENWGALNELHRTLDPEGKNVFVNSDRFYEVMDQWTKKMEQTLVPSQEENFASLMTVDDDDLSHSTTKSRYSQSQYKQPEVDNTEEIKELKYQMQKIFNELGLAKQQLIANEEVNEILHGDLLKLNQKLAAEQQICENLSENLQKSIRDKEKLREELTEAKTNIRELKKTVSRFQKDCIYHESKLNKIENEKTTVEKKLEYVIKQKNDCTKQLDYLGTELKEKEDMLNEFDKLYNELKHTFSEQQEFINVLKEENNVLVCKNPKAQKSQNNTDNMDLMPMDKNNIQYKDFSIKADKTHIKNLTLHDEMSKLNGSNEKFETLLKSNIELAIKNNELGLKNEKLSENLHQAIEAQNRQDLEIITIRKTVEETTKLNEELAKTKENLETIIKDKIDTIQELQDKNMQLHETNKNQIEELKLNHTKIDLQHTKENLEIQIKEKTNAGQSDTKLVEEFNHFNHIFTEVDKNLLLYKEKFDVINEEKRMLHHQLEEKTAIIENFGDLQQKYTFSELKLKNLTEELTNLQKLYAEVQTENNLNKQERNNLKLKLDKLQTSGGSELMHANKEYCQLPRVTELESLDGKYKKEQTKNQQLIIENQKTYNELQEHYDVQVHGEIMSKISNRADRLDSPPLEDINLATKEKLNFVSDSLPLVNCCNDLLQDFCLDDKNLTTEEETKKIADLLSHQLANSNAVKKQLEMLFEKLCCQYKNILMLVRDVSYCLKDHQCTGNAETIVPAYNLLTEIKIQLKYLLQNASQAFNCENQEQSSNSTHTESRQKILKWSSKNKVEEYIPKKRSKFCCCLKLGTITLFGMVLALAAVLGFNCLCRASVPQSISCPLDGIIEFNYSGNLPI